MKRVLLRNLGPQYVGVDPSSPHGGMLGIRAGGVAETSRQNAERLMIVYPGRFELIGIEAPDPALAGAAETAPRVMGTVASEEPTPDPERAVSRSAESATTAAGDSSGSPPAPAHDAESHQPPAPRRRGRGKR